MPTPTSIDWNGLQLSWIDFKKKVRWRTWFYTPEKALDGPEFAIDPLEPPYQKSVKEPPLANVPAIEVFLSRVEKDLFAKSTTKEVSDNLSVEERTALKKFRSTPFEERDLIVRLQDKSNNFVFLDNKLDADKVKEQMERGFFKNVGYDPSPETGLEIEQWINKWQLWVCLLSGLSSLLTLMTHIQVLITL